MIQRGLLEEDIKDTVSYFLKSSIINVQFLLSFQKGNTINFKNHEIWKTEVVKLCFASNWSTEIFKYIIQLEKSWNCKYGRYWITHQNSHTVQHRNNKVLINTKKVQLPHLGIVKVGFIWQKGTFNVCALPFSTRYNWFSIRVKDPLTPLRNGDLFQVECLAFVHPRIHFHKHMWSISAVSMDAIKCFSTMAIQCSFLVLVADVKVVKRQRSSPSLLSRPTITYSIRWDDGACGIKGENKTEKAFCM